MLTFNVITHTCNMGRNQIKPRFIIFFYVGWGSEDTVLPSEVAEMGLLAADLSGINLHKGSEETSEVSVPYLCLRFGR